eukprot:TRINITY_DN2306_c0_g1_i1.p1 TRINITY_DN2306_c0_g1~~TRINITY_DN2306_c0_g1_i1.p1  ORF type:complete len:462 (-),score=126.97 TRINITY_DN2306_c0_g1_i1:52-1437(-)
MSAIVFRVILYRVIPLDCSHPFLELPSAMLSAVSGDFDHELSALGNHVHERILNIAPEAIASPLISELPHVVFMLVIIMMVFLFDISSALLTTDEKEIEVQSENGFYAVDKDPVHVFMDSMRVFGSEEVSCIPHQIKAIADNRVVDEAKTLEKFEWDIRDGVSVSANVEDGVNGVYIVEREGVSGKFGIFKPADEEAFAPENKKEKIGVLNDESPLKSGALVGDAFRKEVAAYVLDHNHRAGVPETKFTSLAVNAGSSPKYGSLQRFVNNEGSSEDFSPSKFSVEDVHAIGLLDTRIANLDRHTGNILVSENFKLVPIDHGFSLPDYRKMKDVTFDWLNWKQASIPFSQDIKDYLNSIDIVSDALTLKQIGIRDEGIVTYLMCSTFTKEAVSAGWTLKSIGEYMQRDLINQDAPSKFEELVGEFISKHNFQGLVVRDKASFAEFLPAFQEMCAMKISSQTQ